MINFILVIVIFLHAISLAFFRWFPDVNCEFADSVNFEIVRRCHMCVCVFELGPLHTPPHINYSFIRCCPKYWYLQRTQGTPKPCRNEQWGSILCMGTVPTPLWPVDKHLIRPSARGQIDGLEQECGNSSALAPSHQYPGTAHMLVYFWMSPNASKRQCISIYQIPLIVYSADIIYIL